MLELSLDLLGGIDVASHLRREEDGQGGRLDVGGDVHDFLETRNS
jgi:hypothetical protein